MRGLFRGGGGGATLGIPKAPNCLTHTVKVQAPAPFRGRYICKSTATESSFNSQHLKESAVPNTFPKTMDAQNAVPGASPLHCRPD